ncbi:hypothetical protein SAMN04488508_10725 [Aquimarina spongiae]|uniref:Uncharacterized protein n=1 Tax=Aquimarina spongiae TaxID=570521 RepID=A0A1M6I0B9_9FLAO|nr:hypothetical protein SAMN04488508_10725 [Aquimarina spongiae]
MKKRKIILIHLTLFITLTAVLFFSAESLLKILAPGFHDVVMWLSLIFFGAIGILILTTISCVIFIKRQS